MVSTLGKILIVAPSWVGDLVMAQTLLKVLKIEHPNATIDVLAPSWATPILNYMPEVKKSIVLPTQHREFSLKKRLDLGKQLRLEHYDQAILLPNSFKSALIPFWGNIPLRTGWLGEMRFGLLNDIRYLDKQKLPLMIERFAALGLPKETPIPPELPWPGLQVDSTHVQATLNQLELSTLSKKKPILALCPGAEYGPAKRWPAAYYAAIANQKIVEGWAVWILGGLKDKAIAKEILTSTQQGVHDFTGKTGLGEAIDLLSLADVVVSNDSGLMHIGAALAKPLVVIYGSSTPKFTPPLTKTKEILSLNLPCSPCFERTCPLKHLNCLNDLKPDRVLKAIFALGKNNE